MNEWAIDLHIHSALSPCAEDSMLPVPVVERCLDFGLDVIALTDHNAIANVQPFIAAGKARGLIVVPGMELETREGIHLICLFDLFEDLQGWDEALHPYKTTMKNDSRFFGCQWVVSEDGEFLFEEERMLIHSVDVSVDDVIPGVHRYGGLCIAAHADRPSNSVSAIFGVLPEQLPFDGIELTRHLPRDELLLGEIRRQGYKYITSCDAHSIGEIGEIHCAAYLDHWSLQELALAMKGRQGRDIIIAR